jgi:hypothetical protein
MGAVTFHRRAGAALLLLAGCLPGVDPGGDERRILALQDPSPRVREDAFQSLLRDGGAPATKLRMAVGLGGSLGFPVAALLYAQSRGDAVPLDLKARHLAGFEWPRATASENAVVEPYVREELEHDLARTGRPALRPLADALRESAGSEAAAMRVVRTMLRIGGRGAAEAFAGLLDERRDVGGARVCDAAAAGLLFLGRQELALRLAVADARVEAARSWWELAKDFPESEWIRDALDGLLKKVQPKDPEGVLPVIELLAGRPLEDPRAWAEANRDWRPAPPPLRPAELLPDLSRDRARAYEANRRLEEATGIRVLAPRLERVSELCAALRLWQPPADLALRWRRVLESPLLRLSIAVLGSSASDERRIRWAYETYFHPTESESGELRIETQSESYFLFVQALDFGTRLVASESHGAGGLWSGTLRRFPDGSPLLMFSLPLKAALVAVVEEVDGRRGTPTLATVRAEWRARLASWADSGDALRALAYFQDPADRGLLRERRAGRGLLLLGDPAALELRPTLEPYEIEFALRKAEDPRVRSYLEGLRTALQK